MDLSGKELSELIEKILTHLKGEKITQSEVEAQLNYTSLSKAKNFEKYPQTVIEKRTRPELIALLLETYNLSYDDSRKTILRHGAKPIGRSLSMETIYVMYYYAFARETMGRAIVRIINKKKVTIEYPMNEYWEGTYEVIENHTFILAEKKGDATPVKKLICLFSGTEKYGRPLLLGVYSTVKRDGFPVAGNIVLEGVDSDEALESRLKGEVDSRIVHFLNEKVVVADTFTPNGLDDLSSEFKLTTKYSGLYSLHIKRSDQRIQGSLKLQKSGIASIVISDISYQGVFRFLDSHTIKIVLKDASEFSNKIKEEIDLILKTNSVKHAPHYIGSGISNTFGSQMFSFECLAIKNSNGQTHFDSEKIEAFFG